MAANLICDDFRVPAQDAGIELHVRNRRPADLTRFAPDNIILFVHGATGSPETSFDLKLDGVSWMAWMAQQGNDVYFVSVRGYGHSTRPREMDEPPLNNAPIVRTDTAVRDVGAAVDFIRGRRGVDKISLLGHSWGTTIMALYTTQNNAKVHRLALYAPGWIRTQGVSLTDQGGELGAYRIVTAEAVKKRRGTGLPPGKQEELMPARWLDAYLKAAFEADPWSKTQTPRAFRAPNGVVADSREYANAGKPRYNPGEIRVPTLLILAEWDADTPPYMAQTLFPLLVNAPSKRLVVIGEGTHVVVTEKNRMQLFREVGLFFEEGRDA
ncbi:MAG: alpha/beta hydrolase [Betaproteobacteria bacterium]|nr:alpha/beta hydrolase [Betaproteobacteria bacterium]